MLIPKKQAFLKHDLFKAVIPSDLQNKAFYDNDEFERLVGEITTKKYASRGLRFVYCATDRKDAQHGWYADDGSGLFRSGCYGFGKMSGLWADEHLTEPEDL